MRKGERTREQVLERAAGLFNTFGYRALPISSIMEATGLQKGGIYRHFESKDQLSLEAFDFAVARMRDRFTEALACAGTARAKLRAVISVYARIPSDPPVPGGCPLLNASVEADDAHPELRERARRVVSGLESSLRQILQEGMKTGELRPGIDVGETVSVLVAALEGAVMLSKLHGSDVPMQRVVRHLNAWVEELRAC